ncbi:MAG: DUF1176 domain-containing protein [Sphingobium sp.]
MGAGYCFAGALVAALAVAGLATPVSARAPAPRPGTLETYRDWTIGCDNRGRCEAVSLLPEGAASPDDPLSLHIVRNAGAQSEVEVRVGLPGRGRREVAFFVDGRRIATAAAVDGDVRLRGPQASALALAMARGAGMQVRGGTKTLGRPSLSGSAAALRYMDAKQGRAGTTTALVATGALGPGAVRPVPAGPTVRRAPVPVAARAPAALWREELAELGKLTGCADEMRDASAPEQHRLSNTETLILIPCGAGAYNATFSPVIATGAAGRRAFRFAAFDYQPGWGGDGGPPLLVNARFRPDASRLESFAKGRGLGDCGGSESYVWDGARFRLVEATAMAQCRGARGWIRTWQAQLID